MSELWILNYGSLFFTGTVKSYLIAKQIHVIFQQFYQHTYKNNIYLTQNNIWVDLKKNVFNKLKCGTIVVLLQQQKKKYTFKNL